jgi:hypothetical protein
MRLRMVFAVMTGIALFLMISTQELRAATAANPGSEDGIHVVAKAELHGAVVASSAEAAKARKSVQDFLARSEVQAQLERLGFEPADVSSRVGLLSDTEILRLQSQVMVAEQQIRTAGVPVWGWIIIGILVAIGVAAIIIAHEMITD